MDNLLNGLSLTSRKGVPKAPSEENCGVDAGKIIAQAAETGRAVVEDADGRPRVIISLPTADLPTFDE
jgi:hypothetical protein